MYGMYGGGDQRNWRKDPQKREFITTVASEKLNIIKK
jgi:hypothetical protein